MESSNQPTSQLSRQLPWTALNPPNWYEPSKEHVTWHLIVRKPFQELREFADWVQVHTRMFVVGQHDADEEVNTTHCHFMINGCDVTKEGLRKELKKYITDGRKEYALMEKSEKARLPYDEWHLAVYVLKGDMNNHKLGKYSYEKVQDIVSAWQIYEKSETKTSEPKITSQYDVIESVIPKMKTRDQLYQGEFGEALAEHAVIPCAENFRILCDALNAHKIRTSRNELERIWVTVLRQHRNNQDSLYESISRNVFR
jgi:hypothetical protein